MANKPLKSIKFPGLEDTYVIPQIDDTLSIEGAAADAKTVGDAIDAIEPGLSEDAKAALLDCFAHVVWIDEHGQDYYDELADALYPDTGLVRIDAVFTQGSFIVYESTPLDELKAYLVVTAYYNDGSSRRISDYTLSGTLTVGTSTITVYREGKTDTFDVIVSDVQWDYIAENVSPGDSNQVFTIPNVNLADGDVIEILARIPTGSSSQTVLRLGTNGNEELWQYANGTKYLMYASDSAISSCASINNPQNISYNNYLYRYVIEPITYPVGSAEYNVIIDANGYSVNGVNFDNFIGTATTSNVFANHEQAKARINSASTLYVGIGSSPAVITFDYIRVYRAS